MAVGAVATVPLLLAGGLAVYVRGQAGELERLDVPGLVPADSTPVASAPPVDEPPPLATPLNILVAGVDRRPPGSEVEGSRSDSIAVVRIDPFRNRVAMLSLPRDLWVTAENGRSGRINSFPGGGDLVGVVSSLLDIDINHYVEVDFEGFASLIDLAGGVTVPFENAVRDSHTGFVADAGCNELTGAEALALARSRYLQVLDPATGEWTTDPTSDLGRIARQQDLTMRVLAAVLSEDYGTADTIRILTDVVDDIAVDVGLDLDGLRAIFNAAQHIGVDNFETYDLNGSLTAETIDNQAVLVADPNGIERAVAHVIGREADQAPTEPGGLDVGDNAIRPSPVDC